MQFVITAYDGEGMLDKRMEVRPLHLEGMERLKKHLLTSSLVRYFYLPCDGTHDFTGVSEDLTGDAG